MPALVEIGFPFFEKACLSLEVGYFLLGSPPVVAGLSAYYFYLWPSVFLLDLMNYVCFEIYRHAVGSLDNRLTF